jgi:hydrogenase maturation protein HypF
VTTVGGWRVRVRGVVQGVGFRPFVYRLAERHALAGCVTNSSTGVEIRIEGRHEAVEAFLSELRAHHPAAACIADLTVEHLEATGLVGFHIGESEREGRPSMQISVDLPVCDECLREMFDPRNRRFEYPYINCTECGPRFSLATALPYDRCTTTMASWAMCPDCHREFNDPSDRRFHAQPIACPACGPGYSLVGAAGAPSYGSEAIARAADLLCDGAIVAIKGIGGYHLACDARSPESIAVLRQRKYRKDRAFALMVPDVSAARLLIELSAGAEARLTSRARPIVLAHPRLEVPGVAPDHSTLGVMLPYTPLHHLLFAAGVPDVLVMTSGNRSSEPIAFDDEDARRRLAGIADALLVGERPIARRVDDSVVRDTPLGPTTVRRSRGYAPAIVARLHTEDPILSVGGDLKNTVALAIAGEVMVSQHIGDLEHYDARAAFDQTIRDLLKLYEVDPSRLIVAHDQHPQYASTAWALALPALRHVPVQHHRAHVASVLAERDALTTRVLGVAFDGTGFGDDGTVWGGEFFVGSVQEGFERVAHLRPVALPGADAAAVWPVQAAAGFAAAVEGLPELDDALEFPERYALARRLIAHGLRTFTTTSVGRLFDAISALLGWTKEVTFEAQAAIWLESQASMAAIPVSVPFEYSGGTLDWRPAFRSVIEARLAGASVPTIALGFHRGLADGVATAVATLCAEHELRTVALSGGVFQNQLLLASLHELLAARGLTVWINIKVPASDGGLSLGQAAIASMWPKVAYRS